MVQLSQMLIATKNFAGALAVYCKIILTLSVTIQRSFYCLNKGKLDTELKKQIGGSFNVINRLTHWVQLHNGPKHDSPAPIYRLPIWHFEVASTERVQSKEESTAESVSTLAPIPSRERSVLPTAHKAKATKDNEVTTTDHLENPPDEGTSALTLEGSLWTKRPLGSGHATIVSPYSRFRRRGAVAAERLVRSSIVMTGILDHVLMLHFYNLHRFKAFVFTCFIHCMF